MWNKTERFRSKMELLIVSPLLVATEVTRWTPSNRRHGTTKPPESSPPNFAVYGQKLQWQKFTKTTAETLKKYCNLIQNLPMLSESTNLPALIIALSSLGGKSTGTEGISSRGSDRYQLKPKSLDPST